MERDLEAYAAWLKTEDAARAFKEANEAADEDAEVFHRMNNLDWETWNTPLTPSRGPRRWPT